MFFFGTAWLKPVVVGCVVIFLSSEMLIAGSILQQSRKIQVSVDKARHRTQITSEMSIKAMRNAIAFRNAREKAFMEALLKSDVGAAEQALREVNRACREQKNAARKMIEILECDAECHSLSSNITTTLERSFKQKRKQRKRSLVRAEKLSKKVRRICARAEKLAEEMKKKWLLPQDSLPVPAS